MRQILTSKPYISVLFLGIISFIPFLGRVHLFDWDEINFAECAREMIVMNDYLRVHINFEPFWEKPPLFIWFQVLSMKIFGINEFAARFPNAVCGIVTLLLLFHIGKKHYSNAMAWFWVLAYWGALLPHLYFKSGIIDPFFNLFIFIGIYFFTQSIDNQKIKQSLFGGFFIGLAILTKGPVAYLVTAMCFGIYWIFLSKWNKKALFYFIAFSIMAVLTTSLWFGVEIYKNGTWFVKEFIVYQIRLFQTKDSGHGGFFGYHFVVLLLGCFPASLFAIKPLFSLNALKTDRDTFQKWLFLLFWIVLILFSIVKTKILHYSSLCYFPLTFFAALQMEAIYNEMDKFYNWLKYSILSIGLIFTTLFLLLPYFGQHIEILKPLFKKDPFALGNLEANVIWTNVDYVVGIVFLLTILMWKFYLSKINFKNSIILLFGGTALVLQMVMLLFLPKIEGYSQNAAIEFYKSMENKNAYVTVDGFKSFAHLFYTKKPNFQHANHTNQDWLLDAATDRPVFVVIKNTYKNRFNAAQSDFYSIGEKNGFVFYRKEKQK